MSEKLQQLITAIGEGATEQLLMSWGGQRIVLPQDMRCTHPIALRIGSYQAERLINAMGAGPITLPAYGKHLRRERDRRIRQMASAMRTCELAQYFGLSERQIRYILSDTVKNEKAIMDDNTKREQGTTA